MKRVSSKRLICDMTVSCKYTSPQRGASQVAGASPSQLRIPAARTDAEKVLFNVAVFILTIYEALSCTSTRGRLLQPNSRAIEASSCGNTFRTKLASPALSFNVKGKRVSLAAFCGSIM